MHLAKLAAPALLFFLLLLAACGDDSTSKSANTNAPSSPSQAGPSSRGTGQPPATVDVCALFNVDDAKAVAQATNSGHGADITMTTESVTGNPPTLGGCKFHISSPPGTIEIDALPADQMAIFRQGSKQVPGLGDEAFTNGGTAYVRVGNVMLSVGENSFTQSFVVEVYKRMAPKMKK